MKTFEQQQSDYQWGLYIVFGPIMMALALSLVFTLPTPVPSHGTAQQHGHAIAHSHR